MLLLYHNIAQTQFSSEIIFEMNFVYVHYVLTAYNICVFYLYAPIYLLAMMKYICIPDF